MNSLYSSAFDKFPSPVALACSGFGQPSKLHVFTSEATFDHVLIMIFKSGFLCHGSLNSILAVHPLCDHLFKSTIRAFLCNFRSVSASNYNWQKQDHIPQTPIQKFLAASLFYNSHLASIIRYASGNYVGAHMDADRVKKEIEGIVPPAICKNVDILIRVGAPHHIYGHSSTQIFYKFKRYGNHSSIPFKPEKIIKVMNKKHKHNYAIALPSWISRFVPNLHLTPQGLVVKEGKNDRRVFDASFKPEFDSFNINLSANPKTAPPIEYGTTFSNI